MATTVFRVEKNKNFTIVSNHHLRDKNLSLKAKGLLTLMLSFSDDWDYTLKGLVAISKDGIDATRATLDELEKSGYLKRSRTRNELGQLQVTEYTVYEIPSEHQTELAKDSEEAHIGKSNVDEKSHIGKSDMDEKSTHIGKSDVDNKSQMGFSHIGKSIYGNSNAIKDYNNKELLFNNNHPSINKSKKVSNNEPPKQTPIDRRKNEREGYCELVKLNIDYEYFAETNTKFIDLVLDVMLDAICSLKPQIKINGQYFPQVIVKSRLLKLDSGNIEYVQQCLEDNKSKIKNIRAYILTTLYNSLTAQEFHEEQNFKAIFETDKFQKREA